MKKTQSILFFILGLILFANVAKGQQDPMFTQYNFNMQTINAAYAGTWDRMGFLVMGRYQWIGMDGAPTTYTFSMQSPTGLKNTAWGLNVIADKVGREKRITLSADYSYRLQVSEKSSLRLGLKGGITNYSNPLTEYEQNVNAPTDVYTEDVDVKNIPNFGVGAFLSSDDYYVGLSVPKLIESDLTEGGVNYSAYAEMRHFYLSAGYVFELGQNLKFKPTTLAKAVVGSPLQVDVTANFLLKDRIWLGGMVRWGDSFGFIGQFLFDDHIRIGYAIDFTTTELSNAHNGIHEIMVSYELGVRKKWTTPRMF